MLVKNFHQLSLSSLCVDRHPHVNREWSLSVFGVSELQLLLCTSYSSYIEAAEQLLDLSLMCQTSVEI